MVLLLWNNDTCTHTPLSIGHLQEFSALPAVLVTWLSPLFFVFFGPRNKCRVATGNWLFDIAVRRKEREEEWKIFLLCGNFVFGKREREKVCVDGIKCNYSLWIDGQNLIKTTSSTTHQRALDGRHLRTAGTAVAVVVGEWKMSIIRADWDDERKSTWGGWVANNKAKCIHWHGLASPLLGVHDQLPLSSSAEHYTAGICFR